MRRGKRLAPMAPALLLISCGLCFLPPPSMRPAGPARVKSATSAALAVTGLLASPAWAEEQMDAATLAQRDAMEEAFDPKRPNRIDLGEYRGEGPWYIFAVVGIAFAIFTAIQAYRDQMGLNDERPTTADDYFNPDFDPYKGMNLKKDPVTGKRPR